LQNSINQISWRRLSSLLSRDSSRLFWTAVGFQMVHEPLEKRKPR
jgi:hypothetical protein